MRNYTSQPFGLPPVLSAKLQKNSNKALLLRCVQCHQLVCLLHHFLRKRVWRNLSWRCHLVLEHLQSPESSLRGVQMRTIFPPMIYRRICCVFWPAPIRMRKTTQITGSCGCAPCASSQFSCPARLGAKGNKGANGEKGAKVANPKVLPKRRVRLVRPTRPKGNGLVRTELRGAKALKHVVNMKLF